jgi:hypothetical protein
MTFKASTTLKYKWIFCGSALSVLIFFWLTQGDEASYQHESKVLNHSIIDTGTSQIIVDSDNHQSSIDVVRLADIARKKSLQVIDPETLTLSQEAIDWLNLDAARVESGNRIIVGFLSNLFQEELSRAYVEVSDEFGEIIVVPSFDRRKLQEDMRISLSGVVGKQISTLIYDRILHDYELGASKTEIRVSVEDGKDATERISFSRAVLAEEAYDADVPINVTHKDLPFPIPLSSTTVIRSSGLSSNGVRPRIAQLMNNADRLPKRPKK